MSTNNMNTSVVGRGVNWSTEEVLCLLSIWKDDIVQNLMEGTSKNRLAFTMVSEKMKENGFGRSADQCRRKMKHLKFEYKKVCDNNRTSGKSRKTCPFYDELSDILGDRPAINPNPESVIDSAVDQLDQDMEESLVDSGPESDNEDLDRHRVAEHTRPLKKRRVEQPGSEMENQDSDKVLTGDNDCSPDKGSTDGDLQQTQQVTHENKSRTPSPEDRPKCGSEQRREIRLKKRGERDSKLQKVMEKCMERHLLHEQKRDKKYDEYERKREEREAEYERIRQEERRRMLDLEERRLTFEREQQELNRRHEMNMFNMFFQFLHREHNATYYNPNTQTEYMPPPTPQTQYATPPSHTQSSTFVAPHIQRNTVRYMAQPPSTQNDNILSDSILSDSVNIITNK
ncbi:uncharacterized protein [Ptychodera flava]|uniref:uncharacterized protein isoform X2 n=1 Tax=Ptychodera flava TaxID=63121 RepID=UPI003969D8EB